MIQETAERVGAPLTWITEPWPGDVNLAGSHQRWNAVLAVAAVKASGLPISQEAVCAGLQQVVWPGRFQRVPGVGSAREIVLDGAHNEHAATRLVSTWQEVYGEAKAITILGVLEDKDAAGILRALCGITSKFILVPVDSSRTLATARLAELIAASAPGEPFLEAESLPAALEMVSAGGVAIDEGCRVLVTGSLFLIGEALAALTNKPFEKSSQ